MGKGTFNGFVSRDGFRYSPVAIPEEVRQILVDLFIDIDKRNTNSSLILDDKSENNSESG